LTIFNNFWTPVRSSHSKWTVNFRVTHAQYVDLAKRTTEKQSYKYVPSLITPS